MYYDEAFDEGNALQTHKIYLEGKHKELNTKIDIFNKTLNELIDDRTKLQKLITNIDIIMVNRGKK